MPGKLLPPRVWGSFYIYPCAMGFPGGSAGKESACDAGDLGLIPGLRISPGEGNGYPLQYSSLDNLKDRGAWLQSMVSQKVGHDWSDLTLLLHYTMATSSYLFLKVGPQKYMPVR